MSEQNFFPEGLSADASRRYYARAVLERAMQSGAILEAPAVLCDADLSLTVALGEMQGVIPRDEVVYEREGSGKDIAVITRVGKTVCFCVQSFFTGADGRPRALLSRRAAQKRCAKEYLAKLRPGDVIPAKVTHMEQFGAFCDVGCGIISLLSVDAVSVSRIAHPRDRFFEGMQILAAVRQVDKESGRLYLSHKELLGTWLENAAQFSAGETVRGIVRSIEDYGIFVELTPNLAGLAERREGVLVGQSAAVYIKSILPDRMKIKLSLIDICHAQMPRRALTYFIRGGHIDTWVYSPPGCKKTVETDFSVPRADRLP